MRSRCQFPAVTNSAPAITASTVGSTALLRLPIVKAVDSQWFGVNLDSGNVDRADVYPELTKIVPYALNVQLKVETGPPGAKVASDVPRVVALLRQADREIAGFARQLPQTGPLGTHDEGDRPGQIGFMREFRRLGIRTHNP